jgi:hypothetical protein
MLDLNVRVPPRLQIVDASILVASEINDHRYRKHGDDDETLNIHGTRLTLSQR